MIALTLTLQASEKPSYHWGSAFHGMLMSLLPGEMAAYLHGDGQRLISQWIQPLNQNRLIWRIQLLDDDVAATVAKAIQNVPELYVRDRRAAFPVIRADCREAYAESLLDEAASARPRSSVTLEICTPATHKSGGRYVTLPTADMIARSLARHVSAVWPGIIFSDDEEMERLCGCLRVGRYALSSATYGVGGSYALGYIGRMELRFDGSEEERRLLNALFSFAPWCGIGAKTSLGMGGCRLIAGEQGKRASAEGPA